MPATSSLIKKLAAKFPYLTFSEGAYAHWTPTERVVYYNSNEPHAEWVILHETAHGILDHHTYSRDIELIKLERQAWDYAAETLAPLFGIPIDNEFIEAQLDTYRDWLHIKSTCPSCQSNGIEQTKQQYLCPHCGQTWQTNTGINVGIRRFKQTAVPAAPKIK